jgi:hypothetical protein
MPAPASDCVAEAGGVERRIVDVWNSRSGMPSSAPIMRAPHLP